MVLVAAVVRAARSADSVEASAVVEAVYAEFGFTWEPDGYHGDLADVERGFAGFWVAELAGRMVGTAGLAVSSQRLGGCDCSLERLYVLREARGTGAGSSLLRAVLEAARSRGLRRMEIWSDKRFVDAHRLYERFGAEVVEERVGDDPDASAEWGLVLPLEEVSSAGGRRR